MPWAAGAAYVPDIASPQRTCSTRSRAWPGEAGTPGLRLIAKGWVALLTAPMGLVVRRTTSAVSHRARYIRDLSLSCEILALGSPVTYLRRTECQALRCYPLATPLRGAAARTGARLSGSVAESVRLCRLNWQYEIIASPPPRSPASAARSRCGAVPVGEHRIGGLRRSVPDTCSENGEYRVAVIIPCQSSTGREVERSGELALIAQFR